MSAYILIGWRILLLLSACRMGRTRLNGDIPPSACSTMLPGHSTNPQQSTPLYDIITESPFFLRNQIFSVYLQSNASMTFKGFYCQARDESDPRDVAGYFLKLDKNQRGHGCFSTSSDAGEFDTISHNSLWSGDPRDFMELSWKVTDLNSTGVKFRCTFVQNYTTFWTGVESDVVSAIESVPVFDCCDGELVEDGCEPLCHDIREKPENLTLAQESISGESEDSLRCPFVDAQRALRCAYWSSSAENFDSAVLQGCCKARNVSTVCIYLCSKEIIGTMDYTEDEFRNCSDMNPGLTSCLIYPGSPISSTNYKTVTQTGSMGTPTWPNFPRSTANSDPQTSSAMTILVSETTSEREIAATSSTKSETNQQTETTVQLSVSNSPESTTETTDLQTSYGMMTTAQPRTTSPTATTSADPQTISQTVPAELPKGRLVYNINVTVNVNGATSDSDLRERVFTALEDQLFTPGIGAIRGYVEVIVGVQYYEGSLITTSEALFDQQDDGYIPTVTEMMDSLTSRLDNIGNEIRNDNQTWQIITPIEVTRKGINNACVNASCGTRQTCVEVGPDGAVCLCLDENNNEIACEPDSSPDTELSSGAVAGIVTGCLILLGVLVILIIFALRRGAKKRAEESQSRKQTSTGSDGGYTYPDQPETEPVYMDIPNEQPPPALPSRIVTLPSHSMGYDAPTDGYKFPKRKLSDLREKEDGYLKATATEYTEPYAHYQANVKESKSEEKVTNPNDAISKYTEPYACYQASDEHLKDEEKFTDSYNVISKESMSPHKSEDNKNTGGYVALDDYEIAKETASECEESAQSSCSVDGTRF